ncbi:Sensitivity To Red Light Reduced-like SRR1 [Penicillium angulare]|uniref:Sensitivity To Red Light Reduced-like SRR1 n=1 Tax=Penicillium angulare TaxID=116970 RepID=A0A9W9EJV4_9EURO|nr:Sensitivity To Red Light Reduced-like SRR1 [Penicillium angulare]
MPHTSRTRKQQSLTQKRHQVTSDDGWTHVTTRNNARRVNLKNARLDSPNSVVQPGELMLEPAEAPARFTLGELERQYAVHRDRWLESETWKRCQETLLEIGNRGQIDGIVCIGLGSVSGFLRDGWVDRRSVSMYQLAALEGIKRKLSSITSLSIPVYIQDPVFNKLDCALLESMGMTIVEHPVAFGYITRNTLLFCPGAERQHLELVLPSKPRILFGGPLEDTESDVIQSFVGSMGSRALLPFSANEHAFWMTRIYFSS